MNCLVTLYIVFGRLCLLPQLESCLDTVRCSFIHGQGGAWAILKKALRVSCVHKVAQNGMEGWHLCLFIFVFIPIYVSLWLVWLDDPSAPHPVSCLVLQCEGWAHHRPPAKTRKEHVWAIQGKITTLPDLSCMVGHPFRHARPRLGGSGVSLLRITGTEKRPGLPWSWLC